MADDKYSWSGALDNSVNVGSAANVAGKILPWSRSTVADGKYMNNEQLIPLSGRDEYLLSAVNNTYDDLLKTSGEINELKNNAFYLKIGTDLRLSGETLMVNCEECSATGLYSFVEGSKTSAASYASHAEGSETIASELNSHAEGSKTSAAGYASHAEGYKTIASGSTSHAEGFSVITIGNNSHAEGCYTSAVGENSHAEGYSAKALGKYDHAEGYMTTANGVQGTGFTAATHAEGWKTSATNYASHAEGMCTTAAGYASHAQGGWTLAGASESLAGGWLTSALGQRSTVLGNHTKSTTADNLIIGKANKTTDAAFVIGNGTFDTNTSPHSITGKDIFKVDWEGAVNLYTTAANTATNYPGSAVFGNKSTQIRFWNNMNSDNNVPRDKARGVLGYTIYDDLCDKDGKSVWPSDSRPAANFYMIGNDANNDTQNTIGLYVDGYVGAKDVILTNGKKLSDINAGESYYSMYKASNVGPYNGNIILGNADVKYVSESSFVLYGGNASGGSVAIKGATANCGSIGIKFGSSAARWSLALFEGTANEYSIAMKGCADNRSIAMGVTLGENTYATMASMAIGDNAVARNGSIAIKGSNITAKNQAYAENGSIAIKGATAYKNSLAYNEGYAKDNSISLNLHSNSNYGKAFSGSVSIGDSNTWNGSFALGNENTVSGGSYAIGYTNTIIGGGCYTIGYNNLMDARSTNINLQDAYIFGRNNMAWTDAYAIGCSNTITGTTSAATRFSFGIGLNNVITGTSGSFAIGKELRILSYPENNTNYGKYVIGQYNDVTNSKYFTIGNGTADNQRSNALTITTGGDVSARDFIAYNGNKLSECGKGSSNNVYIFTLKTEFDSIEDQLRNKTGCYEFIARKYEQTGMATGNNCISISVSSLEAGKRYSFYGFTDGENIRSGFSIKNDGIKFNLSVGAESAQLDLTSYDFPHVKWATTGHGIKGIKTDVLVKEVSNKKVLYVFPIMGCIMPN